MKYGQKCLICSPRNLLHFYRAIYMNDVCSVSAIVNLSIKAHIPVCFPVGEYNNTLI